MNNCIPANPDITGIGVRTAIYAQNLLSFLPAVFAILDKKVSPFELEALKRQSKTILITAFAILLSAIIQALAGFTPSGLTNYHATVILNLSWINNTNTFIYFILYFYHRAGKIQDEPTGDGDSEDEPTEFGHTTTTTDKETQQDRRAGSVSWSQETKKVLVNSVLLIGSLHLSLMAAVGIWLWSNPLHFSDSPECTRFASVVALGHGIPFVSRGLKVWSLLIYSLLLIPALNLTIPVIFFVVPFLAYHKFIRTQSSVLGKSITPIIVSLTILFSINIVFLVDTEATIGRNSRLMEESGDDLWTFGQTLALLLLLVPLQDLVGMILERRPKQLAEQLLEHARQGHLNTVKYVLELGADIDFVDLQGQTALSYALQKGHWNIVKLLLKKGANINNEALFTRRRGAIRAIGLLSGLTVNAVESGRYLSTTPRPLAHFIEIGQTLERVSRLSGEEWLQLSRAAGEGRLDVVKLLLKKRAEIAHDQDHEQWTRYRDAIETEHVEFLRSLSEWGANVSHKSLFRGATRGRLDVVKSILKEETEINEKGENKPKIKANEL